MTDSMDPMDDMEQFLSDHADQLLTRAAAAADLPEDVAALGELLSNLRIATVAEDSLADARMVATIAAQIRDNASYQRTRRGARVLGRRVSAKAGAVVLVAALASGTAAAAAATGSLPAPVQRVVSDALSHFHISVPNPDQRVNVPGTSARQSDGAARKGPAAATGAGARSTGAGTGTGSDPRAAVPGAHSNLPPTSTSQPNGSGPSVPGSSSSPPPVSGGNPNANPNGKAHAYGHANGTPAAPGHGNVLGVGKPKGNGNAYGKGKAKGKPPAAANGVGKAKGKPAA